MRTLWIGPVWVAAHRSQSGDGTVPTWGLRRRTYVTGDVCIAICLGRTVIGLGYSK